MGCFNFLAKAFVLPLLASFLILTACGGGEAENEKSQASNSEMNTDSESQPTASSEGEAPIAVPLKTKDLLYAWVDKLNIRDQQGFSGKSVTSVQSEDALEFTGEKSDQTNFVVLRGIGFDEPWLKVITKDGKEGKEGWVFGGAVKHKGEMKGHDPITDTKFDFPYFGKYDLSSWKKTNSLDESGGDAEIETNVYSKGGQTLETSISDVGEYGRGRTYTLKNSQGEILKNRTIHYSADILEFSETVEDFTSSPPMRYERIQKIPSSYSHFKDAELLLANGSWTSTVIKDAENQSSSTSLTGSTEALPTKFDLLSSGSGMPKIEGPDDGCSCSFRTHPNDYKTGIFSSTFEDQPKEKAVILLNGKYVVLNSGKVKNPNNKLGDFHRYYYNDTYELNIVAFNDGPGDGGSMYSGTIKLTHKDGTELIYINTFGSCGC